MLDWLWGQDFGTKVVIIGVAVALVVSYFMGKNKNSGNSKSSGGKGSSDGSN